jgi:hypothetical protein
MTLWDTEFERRQLRIVGGVCVETMSLPNALVSPSQMGVAVIPLNARKFEFDPPLLVHPDDPFSIEITSVLVSNGAPVPISQGLGNSSLSLVIGGYVLYPGEY